jgi:hypothetical protein
VTNPIQYTSRTFLTALSDINSDPLLADKPDWFKRLIAGMVDVASTWENASANNGFLRTALTRRAVTDLCNLIDYSPAPQYTASGTLFFDASPSGLGNMPFTLTQPNVAANGPSGMSNSALRYGARAALSFVSMTEVLAAASWGTGTITDSGTSSFFYTGEKVRLTTSGTLPTGLSINTDYFIIVLTQTGTGPYNSTLQLASTRANALAGIGLTWASYGSGNHTIVRMSRPITCYQENDVSAAVIGNSDGVTPFQEFQIGQAGILSDTMVVVINSVTYTLVTTLALSAPTDKVFRVYYNTDGTCTLRFGNGVYGAIPPAAPIYVSYSYGGGSKSNVSNLNQVTSYVGGDANVNGCFNQTVFTGGADPESLDSAKKNASLLLKARSRFVTVGDGQALALGYGGLALCTINRNAYGTLSAQVVGIASGGGNPSPTLRTAIATYLQNLSTLSAIYVQFDAATLTAVTANLNVHLLTGYVWATVSAYVDIAVRLFFSETGAEVLASYVSGGIAAAVAKINTIFSKSFGTGDYVAITAILTALTSVGPRNFADAISISDFYVVAASPPGVDYVSLTSSTPTIPYTCGAIEITTMTGGAVNLTQV